MEMSGAEKINAPRAAVWAALNNPEILQASIPGCESLTMSSPTAMNATVTTRVGPVKATFVGDVTLSDIEPSKGYTIVGEGKGGPAGYAKGGAKVRLEDDGAGTMLHYDVKAEVGGKLAQLGGRLIDSTARKLAGEFFASFGQIVGGAAPPAAAVAPAAAPAAAPARTATSALADASTRAAAINADRAAKAAKAAQWTPWLWAAITFVLGFVLGKFVF